MNDQRPARLMLLAVLGCFMMLRPVMGIFDWPGLKGALPVLYLYLFTVWAIVIGLTAFLVRFYDQKKNKL